MKFVRPITAAATAGTLALTLTACSSNDAADDAEGPVTLTVAWWGNDDRASRYQEALDLFSEQHPDITIQSSFTSFDDYWTARNTEAAAGALPDVMQFDSSFLRQYAGTGQLLDVGPYLGEQIDTTELDDQLIDSGRIGESVYAVPTATNTLAMFYNPTLLDELGMEPPSEDAGWDGFADWVGEYSAAGADHDPALYGSNDYTGIFWAFLQHLVQEGITPFTEEGEIAFTPEDMATWLHSGDTLREDEAVFPIERNEQLSPEGGFTVNEQATEMSWDNFLAGYVAGSGQDDISMLPIPSGSDGAKHMFSRTFQMSASATTEHPEEVATLLDFFVNEPEVGRIFGTSKGVPAVAAQRDAMDLEPGSVDETVVEYEESVADQITESAPLPVEGFGSIEAEYKRLGDELAYGTITVDEFVDQWFAFAEDTVGAM